VTAEISVELPSEPGAAAAARLALMPLAEQLDSVLFDDVRLLVSELVTNSVRHTNTLPSSVVRLEVSLSPTLVRIDVTDAGPGFTPRERTPDQDQGSGWGIFLVARLSERWGVMRNGGAHVWCELRRDSARAV
jgi:anti-sigma regulatory factor (Ser/Thr protein kinase)